MSSINSSASSNASAQGSSASTLFTSVYQIFSHIALFLGSLQLTSHIYIKKGYPHLYAKCLYEWTCLASPTCCLCLSSSLARCLQSLHRTRMVEELLLYLTRLGRNLSSHFTRLSRSFSSIVPERYIYNACTPCICRK